MANLPHMEVLGRYGSSLVSMLYKLLGLKLVTNFKSDQVLDYHDVSKYESIIVHDFTLLLIGIWWIL